jgi:putative membrane protein
LAESKGASKDVRAFGKQMVTDHSGVNKQAVALAKKLKVTPEDNPTSQSLKKGGEDNLATLKGLKGAAFDKPISITKSPTTSRCWMPSTRS